MVQTITSIKDKRTVLARSLQTRRGRATLGKVLLEGDRIIDWALERGIRVEFILATNQYVPSIATKYDSREFDIFTVSEGIQKKVTGTKHLISVVGVGESQTAHAVSVGTATDRT